jgi:hypothetical protein
MLVVGSGPTVGASEWRYPKDWNSNLASRPLQLISVYTGKPVWTSNTADIGSVVWADNNELITIKLNISVAPYKFKRLGNASFGATCAIYGIKNKAKLWEKRLRSIPGALSTSRFCGMGRLVLRFSDNNFLIPVDNARYLASVHALEIQLPVKKQPPIHNRPKAIRDGQTYEN